jgi:hypothetical protein
MLTYFTSAPMRDNSIEYKQFACDAGGPTITAACDWLLSRHCCPFKSGFYVSLDASKGCRSGMTCFNRPQDIDATAISLTPDQ